MRRALVAALLLAAVSGARAAGPPAGSPTSRSPASGSLAALEGRVLSDGQGVARAVVLLLPAEPIGAAPPPPPRSPPTVKLDEVWLSFTPKVQVVPPGATLVLSNHDDETHTVHARTAGRTLFNVASIPGGDDRSAILDGPGVVAIGCDLHDAMHAFIVVSRAQHVAIADEQGRFSVAGAPAGRYRVRVWRPGQAEPAVGAEPGTEMAVGGAGTLELPRTEPLLLDVPALTPSEVRIIEPTPPASATVAPARPARALWPAATWAVALLSGAAIALGLLLAIANLRLAARRGWSRTSAVLYGCALALLSGLTIVAGLHVAVATGLGFGVFIGTAIFAAADTV